MVPTGPLPPCGPTGGHTHRAGVRSGTCPCPWARAPPPTWASPRNSQSPGPQTAAGSGRLPPSRPPHAGPALTPRKRAFRGGGDPGPAQHRDPQGTWGAASCGLPSAGLARPPDQGASGASGALPRARHLHRCPEAAPPPYTQPGTASRPTRPASRPVSPRTRVGRQWGPQIWSWARGERRRPSCPLSAQPVKFKEPPGPTARGAGQGLGGQPTARSCEGRAAAAWAGSCRYTAPPQRCPRPWWTPCGCPGLAAVPRGRCQGSTRRAPEGRQTHE